MRFSTFGLATRNLMRHRKRTTVALSAITFGLVALLLAGGFIEWIFWAMREAAIQGRLGHIQVSQPGYAEKGFSNPFSYLLPEKTDQFALLAEMPEVKLIASRLNINGIISVDEISIPFIADGVEPSKESKLSVDFRILTGHDLSDDDPSGIIVGQGLADVLGVQPGDWVTLLANTTFGGFNGLDAQVRGIFYTSNKLWNDSALRMPIKLARDLLRVQGSHVWVVLLHETEQTPFVIQSMRNYFSNAQNPLEFSAWYDKADFYNKTVTLFSRQVNIVAGIIGLIIMLGISNTLSMTVSERTGEIGTLLAIGIKRREVRRLFLTEGFLLGLIAGLIGLTLGFVLAKGISFVGIPMPPAPGMDHGYSAEIIVTSSLMIKTFGLALVTSTIASFLPAWRASRLEITFALRHNL